MAKERGVIMAKYESTYGKIVNGLLPPQAPFILAAKTGRTRWNHQRADECGAAGVGVFGLVGFYAQRGQPDRHVHTLPRDGRWHGLARGVQSPAFRRRVDVKRWLDCQVARASVQY
jgi:hypothetical protein